MLLSSNRELIELQIALVAETIGKLRVDPEFYMEKLSQNLKKQLYKLVQSQRCSDLQINTDGWGVENEPGFSNLREANFNEHAIKPLSPWEEFDVIQPNPFHHPKLCPPVKN